MRNIEIKAKVNNPDLLIGLTEALSDTKCTIIKQHDTFFKVKEGRLKLRQFEDGSGQLIYYERCNTTGPKMCDYQMTSLDPEACTGIKNVLTASNGCLGVVRKTRKLYMIGQTRVHIDEIEGLGSFMELEVVLEDDQSTETGEKIAQDLMTALNIKTEDLIANAYMDLLNTNTTELKGVEKFVSLPSARIHKFDLESFTAGSFLIELGLHLHSFNLKEDLKNHCRTM